MPGILRKLLRRELADIKVPPVEVPGKEKPVKAKILILRSAEELEDGKSAFEEFDILFIRIPPSLVGSEKSSFLKKLKFHSERTGKHFYGLDLRWFVASRFERQ